MGILTRRNFRLFVIIQWVALVFCAGLSGYFYDFNMDEHLLRFIQLDYDRLESQSDSSWETLLLFVSVALELITLVGLLVFAPWVRPLLFVQIILFLVDSFTTTYTSNLIASQDSALYFLMGISTGITLVLVYLTDLKDEFSK